MAGTMCAGIDWASEAHEVCVSQEGEAVERFSATHDEARIAALTERLAGLGVARVAIERPDGILVEGCWPPGLWCWQSTPNQVKAARPRFAVAHGRSDRFDAYVLAELARTDAHRFRTLTPENDETKALQALTRAREDLVGARVRLANELRAPVGGYLAGSADLQRGRLADLAGHPRALPKSCERQGARRGAHGGFLARNGYSGRTDPAELVRRMKAAPKGTAGQAECAARRAVVAGLVATLGPISRRSPNSTPRSASASRPIQMRRSSGRCFGTRRRRSARRP